MGCNCKTTESILAIIIIVFAVWPALIGSATVGKWIVVVAAVLLLLHALKYDACGVPAVKGKAKKKK